MSSENRLNNVMVDVTCELGRVEMTLGEVRRLKVESVIETAKLAGSAFDVRLNGRLFAEGEVVVVYEMMAIRLTNMVDVCQEVNP